MARPPTKVEMVVTVSAPVSHGHRPATMQAYFKVGDVDFYATGLSLVIHPKNPMAPTVHANFRYFEMYEKDGTIVDSWFGGGLDLTPYYLFEEDASHFHQVCKNYYAKDFYPIKERIEPIRVIW